MNERVFACPNCGGPVAVRLERVGLTDSSGNGTRLVYAPVVTCVCGEELQVMFA